MCGSVAEWLGCWTCDLQVAGSNPGLPAVECNPGQVVNTATKEYNLVPAKWGVMACGWEGNCRSGVALATRHRHSWFSTCGFKALERDYEHPPTL